MGGAVVSLYTKMPAKEHPFYHWFAIDRNGSGDVDDAAHGVDCEVLCHAIEKADYAGYRLPEPWEVES